MKYTKEQFVEKANIKHNNKYDYSIINYIDIRTNINIICLDHGIFNQCPSTHLARSGCPSCAKVIRYTTEEYIEEVKKIHGDKYDYSLVEYKNSYSNIKIICPEHGLFEQITGNHRSGRGCPSCVGVKKITI